MSYGNAKINATPTLSIHAASSQEIGVELRAAETRVRENEYKYTYNYGFRQLGEPLIDYRRDSKNYADPQDVELIVLCRAEEGHHLTYVEVKIDISSEDHEAHVIGGGIGQEFIRILIKARNTYWIKYESRMYARPQVAVVHLEKD